jgi:long-chain acyl-CoA synthetase
MFRWWKDSNGNGHGDALTTADSKPQSVPAEVPEPPAEPEVEPPYLAQLDREGIPRTLRYPSTTLGRLLDQTADRFGDNPALVYNHKSRWTYRELLAHVNRMAGGLGKLGVRKGDRVVVTLPNCPEYVVTFFAVQKLGAVLVNAGPLMGPDDLGTLITLTTPRVVIGLDLQASKIIGSAAGVAGSSGIEHFVWVTLQSYQTLLRRIGYQIKLWQSRERSSGAVRHVTHHTTLAKLLENAPARGPSVEPAADATAVLQPTSGTTGALKLVQLSHRNLLSNAMQMSVWMGARDGQETVLSVLPMFHVYGLMTGLINPIFCAAKLVIMTRFECEQALNVLLREHPTVFPLVPAICDSLSNEIEQRHPRPELTGLRVCISGAAPLPREVAERFEQLTGGHVIEGYGLSETSPVTHANLIARPRYGSIGLPMPDTRCRIADLDDPMREAAMGQPGELLVSGPQIMSGYYGNPDATNAALWADDDGRVWLRTGDVARMDEDGFFQILERKKDMIIHSGLKVYPAKVERVLGTHPLVSDVSVIGAPDAVHTEEVTAFVVLTEPDHERQKLTMELRALCREHLAPYEVPTRFEFVQQIPRNVLGKALKKVLREQLRQAAAAPATPPASPTPPNHPHPNKEHKEAA